MKKEQFLAMSLPSGVKVVCTDLIKVICEDVGIGTNRRLIEVLRGNYSPVLHPLSDLTKEITHNGETFVPIDRLPIIGSEVTDFESDIKNGWIRAKELYKLIEWHFNLMDESEPFIDVNSLEINPYA